MSYMLPHLHSGWEVDQAILTEEDRVVVIRFGRDSDTTCMIQDEGKIYRRHPGGLRCKFATTTGGTYPCAIIFDYHFIRNRQQRFS